MRGYWSDGWGFRGSEGGVGGEKFREMGEIGVVDVRVLRIGFGVVGGVGRCCKRRRVAGVR